MKRLAGTIGVVAALLVVQQVLAPLGFAQVPCGEVEQSLGLCTPQPPPSPSPKPEDKPEKDSGSETPGPEPEAGLGSFVALDPRDTSHLVGVLSRLQPYGSTLREALLSLIAPFPVAGLAWWANDWHAARCCPSPHLHQGLDIFAEKGTSLVAAADGVITQRVDEYPSGKGIEITDEQGTEYFYAHLDSFAPGLHVGDEVTVGDLIGTVGKSGNARRTKPHLHFEIQPEGIPAPPKPIVDGWLEDAEARAIQLLRDTVGTVPLLDEYDFRLTRLFDLSAGAGLVGETPGELLTLAGIQPGLPSLEVAMQVLSGMAWEIDWGLRAEEALLQPSR